MHDYEEGDVVVVDLGKSLGHEQKGRRPSIIIANPQVGGKTLGLVVIIPLTTKEKNWWTMVKIEKGDGGVKNDCFAMCHQIRAISVLRVITKWGKSRSETLNRIKTVLSNLLAIP